MNDAAVFIGSAERAAFDDFSAGFDNPAWPTDTGPSLLPPGVSVMPPEANRPNITFFALIFTAALAVLVGVWLYFILGGGAVSTWVKTVITLAIVGLMVFAWRLHRWRQQKALELLQRWAEKDDPSAGRRPRG